MKNFAVVDIETTGTYAGGDGMTEIAIVLYDGKKIIDSFESLINPGMNISPYVSRLTGITNEMVAGAPKFYEIAKKVWTMTEDAIFVAHSVNFDYSFIRQEFKNLGADFRRDKLCTVRLSRKVFPGYTRYGLGNICTTLGIEIENRHRAMGDAAATTKLLARCLENDNENFISGSLKKNSYEALLPPEFPAEVFKSLPEKTGVYYFHDAKGKIIYVGKAINIKKRIAQHFSGKGGGKLSFINSIANVTYNLCGTELIALLLESDEIKRLFPIYNQSQKFTRNNYVLVDYPDQQGITHLVFTKNHKHLSPIKHFRSYDAARECLLSLIRKFKLCPKYCGVQTGSGCCFDYRMGKCKGVCAGSEPVNEYNLRVRKAVDQVNELLQTKLIVDQGREMNERSVVLVENGVYKGFGYFPSSVQVDTPENAQQFIQPFKHNPDVQRILAPWIEHEI